MSNDPGRDTLPPKGHQTRLRLLGMNPVLPAILSSFARIPFKIHRLILPRCRLREQSLSECPIRGRGWLLLTGAACFGLESARYDFPALPPRIPYPCLTPSLLLQSSRAFA